jgi:PBP1b-binding outer membrane lipoprotein LpoB
MKKLWILVMIALMLTGCVRETPGVANVVSGYSGGTKGKRKLQQ